MLEPPSLSTMLKSGAILFFAAIDYKDKIQKIRQTAYFSYPAVKHIYTKPLR